jgi:hypothetical protein
MWNHVLLRYEVCWQVTHRLQSTSYSGMRFVYKLHTDYYPCMDCCLRVTCQQTSYQSKIWIIICLCVTCQQTSYRSMTRYEVCWQVTHRLQSISYSGMRFVDKLHTDYNLCLNPVWGLLTSYRQITIHVLLRYEVLGQVTSYQSKRWIAICV